MMSADRDTLVSDLARLGLRPGMILLVHCAMSSLGTVAGGAVALRDALLEVLGPEGTLVVPTFTPGNSLSSRTYRDKTTGLSSAEQAQYRRSMVPFDPMTTPSDGMGWFAEVVRTSEKSVRSAHPQTSFAAIGACAEHLMVEHDFSCHLGEESPLGRLYEQNAEVLLVGTGYGTCTVFHLAEYRYVADPPRRKYQCLIREQAEARWWIYEDVALDDSDFPALGADLDAAGAVLNGRVAGADVKLVPVRLAVDFAADWLARNR